MLIKITLTDDKNICYLGVKYKEMWANLRFLHRTVLTVSPKIVTTLGMTCHFKCSIFIWQRTNVSTAMLYVKKPTFRTNLTLSHFVFLWFKISAIRKMSTFETLKEDRLQTEIFLQLHLKTLRKALGQQLQETKARQTEELEKRIYQNSLLSTNVDGRPEDEKEPNHKTRYVLFKKTVVRINLYKLQSLFCFFRFVAVRSSTCGPALTSDNGTSNKQKPKLCSVASTTPKHRSSTAQPCERFALSKTTQQSKEEEDEAECKKKFSAIPVPVHVIQPIYHEMKELREKGRKHGCEQRKLFLLSALKPFSFEEREKDKKEKLIKTLNQVPKNSICVTKTRKHINDSAELKGGFFFSLFRLIWTSGVNWALILQFIGLCSLWSLKQTCKQTKCNLCISYILLFSFVVLDTHLRQKELNIART